MSQQKSDEPRLPDGRPIWAATESEKEARQRELHREAFQKAEAASELARQHEVKVATRTQERLAGGLPSALDLKVDVKGLQPARERLVRGLAWIERERGLLPELEAKRARFLVALGAPEETKAELARVESAVGDAIKRYYESGSVGSVPDLRTSERDELVARLREQDELAGQIADDLLAATEIEIEATRRVVAELEGRLGRWQADAFVEAVGGSLAAEGVKRFEAARAVVALLSAVGQVADGSEFRHIARGTRLTAGAPWPWGDLPLEVAGAPADSKTVAILRKMLSAIEADPRARVEIDPEKLLGTVEKWVSRVEPAAVEVAPKAAPSILRRAADFLAPSSKPAPEPVKIRTMAEDGWQFNDYRGTGPLG